MIITFIVNALYSIASIGHYTVTNFILKLVILKLVSPSRIHQLSSCRLVRPPPKQVSEKASDGKAPLLELWRTQSTTSLPLLPGRLMPRLVVPVMFPSMGQREIFNNLRNIIIDYLKLYSC